MRENRVRAKARIREGGRAPLVLITYPVSALFERRKAKLAGRFPELEDELAGFSGDGGYEGPTRSPDRADAMIWAIAELMLRKERAAPRITRL